MGTACSVSKRISYPAWISMRSLSCGKLEMSLGSDCSALPDHAFLIRDWSFEGAPQHILLPDRWHPCVERHAKLTPSEG
jgi:hypothetical protein